MRTARVQLESNVLRVPIVPGSDPRVAYGDLVGRGVRGVVLEAFGVGNMPDRHTAGWLPWLREQTKAGLYVYLASQCLQGPLQPELYKCAPLVVSTRQPLLCCIMHTRSCSLQQHARAASHRCVRPSM